MSSTENKDITDATKAVEASATTDDTATTSQAPTTAIKTPYDDAKVDKIVEKLMELYRESNKHDHHLQKMNESEDVPDINDALRLLDIVIYLHGYIADLCHLAKQINPDLVMEGL